MKIKINKEKAVPYLVALIAVGVAVYKHNNPKVIVKTKKEVQVVEKVVEVVKYKDRNKTTKRTETRPDGTVIEIEIEDTTKTTTDKTVAKNTETKTDEVVVEKPLPRYQLGIDYTIPKAYTDITAYTLRGGVRLGDLPFYATASIGVNRFTLGLQWEF